MARDLLEGYNASLDEVNQTLSIATDGSIKQMTAIFNKLENAGISVAEYAQKLQCPRDQSSVNYSIERDKFLFRSHKSNYDKVIKTTFPIFVRIPL